MSGDQLPIVASSLNINGVSGYFGNNYYRRPDNQESSYPNNSLNDKQRPKDSKQKREARLKDSKQKREAKISEMTQTALLNMDEQTKNSLQASGLSKSNLLLNTRTQVSLDYTNIIKNKWQKVARGTQNTKNTEELKKEQDTAETKLYDYGKEFLLSIDIDKLNLSDKDFDFYGKEFMSFAKQFSILSMVKPEVVQPCDSSCNSFNILDKKTPSQLAKLKEDLKNQSEKDMAYKCFRSTQNTKDLEGFENEMKKLNEAYNNINKVTREEDQTEAWKKKYSEDCDSIPRLRFRVDLAISNIKDPVLQKSCLCVANLDFIDRMVNVCSSEGIPDAIKCLNDAKEYAEKAVLAQKKKKKQTIGKWQNLATNLKKQQKKAK